MTYSNKNESATHPNRSVDSQDPLADFESETEVMCVAAVVSRLGRTDALAQLVVVRRIVQVVLFRRRAV